RAPRRQPDALALGARARGLDRIARVDGDEPALHGQVQEGSPEVVHVGPILSAPRGAQAIRESERIAHRRRPPADGAHFESTMTRKRIPNPTASTPAKTRT